jgi:hypothetical protein
MPDLSTANEDDQELIRRMAGREGPDALAQAWQRWLAVHQPRLERYIEKLCRPDLLDFQAELLEDVLLALVDGMVRGQYDSSRGSLEDFATGTAKACIRRLRRGRRRLLGWEAT